MKVQCPDCSTRYQLDPQRIPEKKIRVRCPKCRYVFELDGSQNKIESMPTPSVSKAVAPPSPESQAGHPGNFREIDLRSRPVKPVTAVPPVPETAPEIPVAAQESTFDADPFIQPAMEAPKAVEPEPVAEPTRAPSSGMDLEIERSADSGLRKNAFATAPGGDSPVATATEMPQGAAQERSAAAGVATRSDSPEEEKARRLARALVSDILVYNRDLRDKALSEGTLVRALGQEIKKSWELYKEKVTPEMASSNNYFREALNDILADGQRIF